MNADQLNIEAPAWILRGSRAQGPFPIAEVGQDHVVLRVPSDFRQWAHAERVPAHKFTALELSPISLLTQSEEEARSWNARNEPRPGDLIAIKAKRWNDQPRTLRDSIITGVVFRVTAHQVQILDAGRGGFGKGSHTKDSCIVLVKGTQEQFSQPQGVKNGIRTRRR